MTKKRINNKTSYGRSLAKKIERQARGEEAAVEQEQTQKQTQLEGMRYPGYLGLESAGQTTSKYDAHYLYESESDSNAGDGDEIIFDEFLEFRLASDSVVDRAR